MVEIIIKNRDILGELLLFRGIASADQTLFDYLEGENTEDFLEGFPTVSRDSAVRCTRRSESTFARTS